MKLKGFIFYLTCSLIPLITICPKVKGNPVMVSPSFGFTSAGIFLLLLIFTLSIEFLIIYGFLKDQIDQLSKISKPILAVNLFTFPATQLLAIFFFTQFPSNLWGVFLIELYPITLECLLFLKIFRDLRIPATGKKIVLSTFIANITSFMLGLAPDLFMISLLW